MSALKICRECGVSFLKTGRNHIYCSRECSQERFKSYDKNWRARKNNQNRILREALEDIRAIITEALKNLGD